MEKGSGFHLKGKVEVSIDKVSQLVEIHPFSSMIVTLIQMPMQKGEHSFQTKQNNFT